VNNQDMESLSLYISRNQTSNNYNGGKMSLKIDMTRKPNTLNIGGQNNSDGLLIVPVRQKPYVVPGAGGTFSSIPVNTAPRAVNLFSLKSRKEIEEAEEQALYEQGGQ
jgi:hypothetical protein